MVTIRKAVPADADFIKKHAYRLLDFNLPSWRHDKEEMTKADIHHITNALMSGNPDDCVFIAVEQEDVPLGFMHLAMQTDYYTGELHAHITDIVVITEAEGKGIGKLLLAKADEWANEHKSSWITLNVFEDNRHARAVYEKAGYHAEWIKYLKPL